MVGTGDGGWNPPGRSAFLRGLEAARLHAMCICMLSLWIYWNTVQGAAAAVARCKPNCRRFAWGIQSIAGLGRAIAHSERYQAEIQSGFRSTNLKRILDHDHYICLGQIISEEGGFNTKSGTTLSCIEAQQSFRAIYMQLIVTLQPGTPQAGVFDIDVALLARDLGVTEEALFDLAEREANRPGCQFGVLIRIAREEARKAVMRVAGGDVDAIWAAAETAGGDDSE